VTGSPVNKTIYESPVLSASLGTEFICYNGGDMGYKKSFLFGTLCPKKKPFLVVTSFVAMEIILIATKEVSEDIK